MVGYFLWLLPLAFLMVLRFGLKRKCIAFFHPYCNDGGGGERVLWCAIRGLQELDEKIFTVIYTGDSESHADIISKALDRFGIVVDVNRIRMIRLKSRFLLEAKNYPIFTLLGQSLGSLIVAIEALFYLNPSVFVDSMGCAFTYPVARFAFGCKVICYVHYPTISTDMLSLVTRQETSFNNRAFISHSKFWTSIKTVYYRVFAQLYRSAGRCSHQVMCNSSWTCGHIQQIWGVQASIVYPPCNTERLETVPMGERQQLVISISQFRPEKNHLLQLDAWQKMREKDATGELREARLVMIGSCRNGDDEARVVELRRQIAVRGLENSVDMRINVPSDELVSHWLSRARVGLHSMRDEHFGIVLVELQAAGVVPLAHASGGPLTDIIVNWPPPGGLPGQPQVQPGPTGLLAESADEYADSLRCLLAPAGAGDVRLMQQRGRMSARRFSDQAFQEGFLAALGRSGALAVLA